MNAFWMIIAVLFPILGGLLVPFLPFGNRKQMCIYVETVVLITTAIVLCLLFRRPDGTVILFRFTGNLRVGFHLDGVGSIFAGIIGLLWPLATLYAFEYMKHEDHNNVFFMFFTMTYGITMGVALAEGILTMYFFYEMITLITLPLIMHNLSREAVLAGRTYLYYSIGGAAFGFIGMVFLLVYGTTGSFVPGGVLDAAAMTDHRSLLLIVYVLCFCGFSVKAAMFPFSGWLPIAGVAPTPVTALLHAVAVVKAGAFATIRITYYCFGTELLRGTWAQKFLMSLILITIVYGCSRAVKETHFKRRLAWSTVSNLSYILFGVILMSPLGLQGALTHMVCHAVMKICSFFCAGAVIYKTGSEYLHQLDGYGRRMPKVFIIFTISGFALMGVPGLCGFVGKWALASAAVESGMPLAYAGIGALLISAILTAIYMCSVSVRAFFPGKSFDYSTISHVEDPNWLMVLPLVLFTIAIFVFGLHPQGLLEVIRDAAAPLL